MTEVAGDELPGLLLGSRLLFGDLCVWVSSGQSAIGCWRGMGKLRVAGRVSDRLQVPQQANVAAEVDCFSKSVIVKLLSPVGIAIVVEIS